MFISKIISKNRASHLVCNYNTDRSFLYHERDGEEYIKPGGKTRVIETWKVWAEGGECSEQDKVEVRNINPKLYIIPVTQDDGKV